MPTLLCSVGTSWAVVPEAMHLLGAGGFDAVHVLTSSSPRVTPGLQHLQAYLQRHPVREFSISRLAGFAELNDERDHERFEEVLYRWMLAMAPDPGSRYVCLAGGYKTISAAVQKAAAVLGAAEVFHVLCEPRFGSEGKTEAQTLDEVEEACRSGAVRYVRLGPESGWPQLAALRADSYPLGWSGEPPLRDVAAPDDRLRRRLRDIVERSHHIAGAWDRLSNLPFASLATCSRAQLDWLDNPLDPAADAAWVRALPKVELHCHLGGFATHGELLALVRAAAHLPHDLPQGGEPALPAGWPLPAEPLGLEAYMHLGDATGSRLLCDPGCLVRQCELLYQALVGDNVVYAEIRCSPANYAAAGRSAWDVLACIRDTFQRCMDESPVDRRCHMNLILVATRQEGGDRSRIARHLALAVTAAEHWADGCRVVGVDLAGFEQPATRAALFATDFEVAHRVGLAVTVHAGENDDVEGIWQAVFRLNARRLGHALHLREAPDLLRAVAERGIGVELCPYANLQVKGYPLGETARGAHTAYPLTDYLAAGVRATVNSDNLGISAATLSDNLLLTALLCPGITRLDLVRLQANAAAVAFLGAGRDRVLEASLAAVPFA
jgi:adenosine deaminase